MAKPRKGKIEEQKGDNSEAVVRHQKLCLSIDMDKRRIYGYTELDVIVPENGILGLHADNLVIDSVTVDGEPTEFEVFPHYLALENGDRWCAVSSATSAADAAGSVYLSHLDRELLSNLLIMCKKPAEHDIERQEMHLENGLNSSAENNQNVKKVRIDYWVEKAETGIHFDGDVLHTDSQIRRARCWFPCMDDNLQCCCYDLEFTVASNLVAVSTGSLLYQIWTKDVPARKTFVYRLSTPVNARWISLAVAPFEILPDSTITYLSHICLPADLTKLRHTVGFFHSAFSFYEDYLSASFPFGSYTQVFIPPEIAISSASIGAALSIFSSQFLFDGKVINKTIDTRIKLAYALARQWFGVYITPEAPNDDWLLDGLAGFLTDMFIKRFLGNNEARYRRYKANIAVCRADDSGATALSAVAASKNLYGTQCIGLFGKIRSWKSVAILQMLEKQMGPESFRKILQQIVARAQDVNRLLRTLSTKEFRHLANKVGNLERPFLKEFFPRWVGSCGCPVLKMGFSYNKRKNMVELAILRECTARFDLGDTMSNGKPDSEKQEGDGWPGMMSIRVHELDGMYDHPILPMTGEPWQLLEFQCHSRLAAKRFQKTKKSSKPDGSDDNGDTVANVDMRATSDSPLLWLRADPELEYLAEIHLNQPVQMWINQLEKDRDVVAQAQAIATLEALPHLSFSVVNALNNFLGDSKAFWRNRIEAAFALAGTASEETDWAGLTHLVAFYKARRFDANIGLPKPNDFRDFQEYFVLEAIPHAIAMVRAADQKSPREAVEFVLQLLKYNDNSGNPYSDVFWLAALVQSIGELEFGQQSIVYLSSLLKRVDRLLQFDRLMPSYNGILTISCIRSLTQIALKLSEFVPLDRVIELINPFRTSKTLWKVRVEASRSLLDLEFQRNGIDAALALFIRYLDEEPTLRGQVKLGVHAMRLCQIRNESDFDSDVKGETLVALLRLLESPISFNNVILRHYLFCILQVLARRAPTLYGVPKDETLRMGHAAFCSNLKNIFADLVKQSKPPEFPLENLEDILDDSAIADALPGNENAKGATISVPDSLFVSEVQKNTEDALLSNEIINTATGSIPDSLVVTEVQNETDLLNYRHGVMHLVGDFPLASSADPFREEPVLPDNEQTKPMVSLLHETGGMSMGPPTTDNLGSRDQGQPAINLGQDNPGISEPIREPDAVSASLERKKPVFKIKVRKTVTSSRAEDNENVTVDKSQDGFRDVDRGASSSVSVDAPQRNVVELLSSGGNQFPEDVNSCHDVGSHVTASIGSAKVAVEVEELTKELQCTAESSKVSLVPQLDGHLLADITRVDDPEAEPHKYASLHSLTMPNLPVHGKTKEKKKDKGKKRKLEGRKDDPEYLERKRLKKEKKRKEKELAKILKDEAKASTSLESRRKNEQRGTKAETIRNDHKLSLVEQEDGRKDEAEPRQVVNGAEAKATSSGLSGRNEPDIILGGNPKMLAKEILEESILPFLTQDIPEVDIHGEPNSQKVLSKIKVGPSSLALLAKAALMAKHVSKNESKKWSYQEAKSMISESIELSQSVEIKELQKQADEQSEYYPLGPSIALTYVSVLEECVSHCLNEGLEVKRLGGLHVIGTSLHESRRIDNQLRGRAGRQGDPGSTRFMVSLQDEMFQKFNFDTEWAVKLISRITNNEDLPIEGHGIVNQLLGLQINAEKYFFGIRKNLVEFDEVLEVQRKHVYNLRQLILTGDFESCSEQIYKYMQAVVDDVILKNVNPQKHPSNWCLDKILEEFKDVAGEILNDSFAEIDEEALLNSLVQLQKFQSISIDNFSLPSLPPTPNSFRGIRGKTSSFRRWLVICSDDSTKYGKYREMVNFLRKYLGDFLIASYLDAIQESGYDAIYVKEIEREVLLKTLDCFWRDHLINMNRLSSAVNVRSFGHRNPLEEYKIDGCKFFISMLSATRRLTVESLLRYWSSPMESQELYV